MIDVKILAKPKKDTVTTGNTGTHGGSNLVGSMVDEAKHAISADRATHAEQAEYADRAGYTSRAAYADMSGDVAEDSPINDRFLSKLKEDTAQERITFSKGLFVGPYVEGKSGAAINGYGYTELKSITVRENAIIRGNTLFGKTSYINSNGDAVLGKVSVDDVKSKGSTESDRTLIGGKGFELYKDSNGTSHLYVDNAVIRGKLLAAETEIRRISYSGGTMVLSNAGSTIIRVVGLDERGNEVAVNSEAASFKCWAAADDGSTRTMNWWKVGDMAMCKTFNIKDSSGGNRYYWRLVIGRGQEVLEDGKLYDYVVLSNLETFAGGDAVVPVNVVSTLTDNEGNVITFGGVVVTMVTDIVMSSLADVVSGQDGSTTDDAGIDIGTRTYYGFDPQGTDIPMAGDVIVQCGDQVRWLSRGNVIRLCTSSDDGDMNTTPSLSMYHGIGRLRDVIVNGEAKANKSVWQWRDLTALISPTKTYINSDYFYFFSEESGGIDKAQSFSEFKMQSDKVAVSVRDVATGIEKAGVHLNGDDSCIVAKANKFFTENSAGVRTTSVDEDGNLIARSLHSVSKSESKVMYVDIEDGMLTFRTSQNNAMMQFGIDEHGYPSMVCYNPDGSIGCIYGPSGPNNNPLINPNAVLVMGEITGSYIYSKASFAGDKTMHTLSYTVKLTVKNNSGNYKTISNAVLKVKVASPYDAKTVELHSSDEKLLLNQETMDMTYTFVQSFSLPSSTMISIADNATVTVTNEGGKTWTTRINKTN